MRDPKNKHYDSILTDLEDSMDPEDRVSRLLRLLELRCGEDEGESSM